jgi:hypothetical protein
MIARFLPFRTCAAIVTAVVLVSSFAESNAQDAATPPPPAPDFNAEAERLSTDAHDIVGIYDQSVAHLEKVTDDYRRIRALQLMRQRDIAFPEAFDLISSVMPDLDPINRELLRKPMRDPREIAPHKAEVEKVEAAIESMIDLTAKLLVEIEHVEIEMLAAVPAEHVDATLEAIVQQDLFDPDKEVVTPESDPNNTPEPSMGLQMLQEAAREDRNEAAKDLTQLMQQAAAPGVRKLTQGQEAEGKEQVAEGRNEAANEQAGAPDVKDLTQEQEFEGRGPEMPFASKAADIAQLRAVTKVDEVNSVLGRKVLATGSPVEWMFIDTWHTIGPFPNAGRINISRRFPPETIIDLDARYPNGSGGMVQWEFVQSGALKVIPANDQEYAIYYAYTELYFDRQMDLWVAFGSDDRGDVWINGLPIWISSDQLKPWNPAQGFRKVRFEPGVNRILFRVENGWRETAFSLAIRVAP